MHNKQYVHAEHAALKNLKKDLRGNTLYSVRVNQSRQRRKDAVNRVRADVYANKASPYSNNPFTDQRQARLYEKQFMMANLL